MSKYTTELRFICEFNAGLVDSEGYSSVKEIINKSREKIFDFDYPIFDSSYKAVLETKILRHFYTREICEETVGLWKIRLESKLNEIMPYYNKMYESELIEFNPLYTVNLKRLTNSNNNTNKSINEIDKGESRNTNESNKAHNEVTQYRGQTSDNGSYNEKNNATNSNTQWNKYSDTPQGSISNIADDSYLTNARNIINNTVNGDEKNSSSNNSSTNKSDNNTNAFDKTLNTNSDIYSKAKIGSDNTETIENYLENIVGYTGADPNKMIELYRKNFLNIDVTIIKELETLFMQLW